MSAQTGYVAAAMVIDMVRAAHERGVRAGLEAAGTMFECHASVEYAKFEEWDKRNAEAALRYANAYQSLVAAAHMVRSLDPATIRRTPMAVSEEEMIVAVMDVLYPGWRENWSEASKAAEKNRMRRALEAAEAVRGGDAAPPAGTVPVRVAVALDPTDDTASATTIYPGAHGEEHAWSHLRDNRASPVKLCIATIHAPLPAVAEVGAAVEDPTP